MIEQVRKIKSKAHRVQMDLSWLKHDCYVMSAKKMEGKLADLLTEVNNLILHVTELEHDEETEAT